MANNNTINNQISYRQWLAYAKNKCNEKSQENRDLEKDFEGNRFAVPLILLEFITKKSKASIRAYDETLLSIEELNKLNNYLERYLSNEPLAYILGIKEFYARDFIVSSATLIPRPESELIIDEVLKYFNTENEELMFCDIGTGTACLALTLLAELPNSKCIAVDISKEALNIAKKNAEKHDLSKRITFIEKDIALLENNIAFDCIVSNPPYIPEVEYKTLDKNVKEFEPEIALTSGQSGLEVIENVIKFASQHLKEKGLLLIEHGYNQDKVVCEIAARYSCFETIESLKDYAGNWRLCRIIKK